MEDVVSVYAEEHDPTRPVVCVDELPYQLVDDARPPLPCQSGVPRREDYEDVRRGRCNLFGCDAPHTGERHLRVTAQRTARDFAEAKCVRAMRVLVAAWYPEAKCVWVVRDNLNTHTGAALYAAFAPPEARRILERSEWRYTPKHGSWLNQMEIEWSVVGRWVPSGQF